MTQPPDQSAALPPGESVQPPGTALVRLVNVHKSFGSLKVLRGVSLDFQAGKTTVILGPSGTGKSVLLKHIVGLMRPDQGEIWFDGQRVDNLSQRQLVAVRQKVGFLFQMGALFDSMTVLENVAFPLQEHTQETREAQFQRARHVLGLVGLEQTADMMPADLSGGQRKRVALARAIVLEPRLVLYDEPTTGLDPIRSDLINELILSLTRRMGIAGIVVTHDMASARKIADRMVMLYDGHIIADADPQTFGKLDNDVVQRFIHGQADQDELDAIRQGFAVA